MDAKLALAQEPQPFRALLVPHRSLSPHSFVWLMVAISAVSFAAGAVSWAIGAWPVMGFFGLDVLLVYVAFKLNYRSGRMQELLEVGPGEVTLRRRHPSGSEEAFTFATAWVRVVLDEHATGQTALKLAHHDRQLEFATFLNDDERRDFAKALMDTVRHARRPTFA